MTPLDKPDYVEWRVVAEWSAHPDCPPLVADAESREHADRLVALYREGMRGTEVRLERRTVTDWVPHGMEDHP